MATFLTLPTSPDISPKDRGVRPSAGRCDQRSHFTGAPLETEPCPAVSLLVKSPRTLVAPSPAAAHLSDRVDVNFDPWPIPSTRSSTSSYPRTNPSRARSVRASPRARPGATFWWSCCARTSPGAVLASTPTPRGRRRSDISAPRRLPSSPAIASSPRRSRDPRKRSRSSTPHPRTASGASTSTPMNAACSNPSRRTPGPTSSRFDAASTSGTLSTATYSSARSRRTRRPCATSASPRTNSTRARRGCSPPQPRMLCTPRP